MAFKSAPYSYPIPPQTFPRFERRGVGELAAMLRSDSGHVLTEAERLLVWSSYLTNDERGVELVHTVLSKDKVFQQVGELEHEYWGTPDYRYLQLRMTRDEWTSSGQECWRSS